MNQKIQPNANCGVPFYTLLKESNEAKSQKEVKSKCCVQMDLFICDVTMMICSNSKMSTTR